MTATRHRRPRLRPPRQALSGPLLDSESPVLGTKTFASMIFRFRAASDAAFPRTHARRTNAKSSKCSTADKQHHGSKCEQCDACPCEWQGGCGRCLVRRPINLRAKRLWFCLCGTRIHITHNHRHRRTVPEFILYHKRVNTCREIRRDHKVEIDASLRAREAREDNPRRRVHRSHDRSAGNERSLRHRDAQRFAR